MYFSVVAFNSSTNKVGGLLIHLLTYKVQTSLRTPACTVLHLKFHKFSKVDTPDSRQKGGDDFLSYPLYHCLTLSAVTHWPPQYFPQVYVHGRTDEIPVANAAPCNRVAGYTNSEVNRFECKTTIRTIGVGQNAVGDTTRPATSECWLSTSLLPRHIPSVIFALTHCLAVHQSSFSVSALHCWARWEAELQKWAPSRLLSQASSSWYSYFRP